MRIRHVAEMLQMPNQDMALYMEDLAQKKNKRFLHVDHIHYEKKLFLQ